MLRLGLVGLASLLSGCAAPSPPVDAEEQAAAAGIAAAWLRHFDAARRKDAAAACDLYTETAVYAVLGQPEVRGRTALRAMEAAGMASTTLGEVRHETHALRAHGDQARELGGVRGEVAVAGGAPTEVRFEYVAHWRREADGSWRVAHLAGAFPGAAEAPSAADDCDLRPQFEALGLQPRHQGARPTCSIFTTTAVFEFAYARVCGARVRLSPEYCNWAANAATGRTDDGDFFHCALRGFAEFGICSEELWPYGAVFAADAAPSRAALLDAGRRSAEAARLRVRWIRPIGGGAGLSDTQYADLLATLRRGWPVAAGSAHSRVLVGYRADARAPGGGVFLTLDSALGKFDEVTAVYVREQLNDAFVVEAAE